MNPPLDRPTNPSKEPASIVASISNIIELLSMVVFAIGMLMKTQSWPGTSLWLMGSMLGFTICYSILFPIRVKALSLSLKPTQYFMFISAGVSLGLILNLVSVLKIFLLLLLTDYPNECDGFIEGLHLLTILAVLVTFLYGTYLRRSDTNSIQCSIAAWLWPRQLFMLLIAGGFYLIRHA
jgi:hypothetical protein